MLLSLNKAYLGKLCITLVGPSEPEILARQNKSHFSHLFFALNTELIFLLFFKKMQSEQKVKLTSACQNKTFYTKLQMHTVYIAYWLATTAHNILYPSQLLTIYITIYITNIGKQLENSSRLFHIQYKCNLFFLSCFSLFALF